MKNIQFSLLMTLLLPVFVVAQSQTYEVYGSLTGDYSGKIYLFFDGNFRQRDSISSEIKDGTFYFKGHASLPVLARLHMDQTSFIEDFYMDNSRTYVKCTNKMSIRNNGKDTLNMISIVNVEGSNANKLKREFERTVNAFGKEEIPGDEMYYNYYQQLLNFIKKHPKNKLSPYFLGKASSLSYAEVKELNSWIDTSLNKTYEGKTVRDLLNKIDKSSNSSISVSFKDFTLKDSTGREIDTKQFRGKYTLLVLWASWCKPCRAENPDLNLLYQKYKDKQFQMAGISLDKDPLKWKAAIIKDKLHWIQLNDVKGADGALAKYYDIESIPTNFLLDKEGNILGLGLTIQQIGEQLEKRL